MKGQNKTTKNKTKTKNSKREQNDRKEKKERKKKKTAVVMLQHVLFSLDFIFMLQSLKGVTHFPRTCLLCRHLCKRFEAYLHLYPLVVSVHVRLAVTWREHGTVLHSQSPKDEPLDRYCT